MRPANGQLASSDRQSSRAWHVRGLSAPLRAPPVGAESPAPFSVRAHPLACYSLRCAGSRMNSAAADLEGAIEGLYGQGTLTWGAYKKLLALLHSCQVHHVAGEQDVHRWFQEILQGYGTATSEHKGALTRDVSAVLSGLSSVRADAVDASLIRSLMASWGIFVQHLRKLTLV